VAGFQAAIQQVIDLHRRQLQGLIETQGVGRLHEIYRRSEDELREKLERLARIGRGQTFGAHHMRLVQAQVSQGVLQLEGGIKDVLVDRGAVGLKLAPEHVAEAANALHAGFGSPTPIVQAEQMATFQGLYRGVPSSLLDRFKKSSKLYGQPVVNKIKDELSLAIIQGEGLDAAVDRVVGTSGIFHRQRWRAERIVRTELSWGYGVAKQRGMEVLRDGYVPGLQKRLVATWDNRTGKDSKELDGQVVEVSAPFIWHVKNAKGRVKRTVLYMQPPNRPNDREVVIPWHPGWPDPRAAGPVRPSTRGLPG
jgi:hypothetical protein